jgi:hypothetical protein
VFLVRSIILKSASTTSHLSDTSICETSREWIKEHERLPHGSLIIVEKGVQGGGGSESYALQGIVLSVIQRGNLRGVEGNDG